MTTSTVSPGTHPVDVAVRRNLRLLRQHRGWSLLQASRHLGIAPVTLATYERVPPMTTVRSLPVEVAARLADRYGVSPAELFDEAAIVMRCSGLTPSLALDDPAPEAVAVP